MIFAFCIYIVDLPVYGVEVKIELNLNDKKENCPSFYIH